MTNKLILKNCVITLFIINNSIFKIFAQNICNLLYDAQVLFINKKNSSLVVNYSKLTSDALQFVRDISYI